jgi:hypothetical protein
MLWQRPKLILRHRQRHRLMLPLWVVCLAEYYSVLVERLRNSRHIYNILEQHIIVFNHDLLTAIRVAKDQYPRATAIAVWQTNILILRPELEQLPQQTLSLILRPELEPSPQQPSVII